jgi:hypothetical protein
MKLGVDEEGGSRRQRETVEDMVVVEEREVVLNQRAAQIL